jgi:hypothetical protein
LGTRSTARSLSTPASAAQFRTDLIVRALIAAVLTMAGQRLIDGEA